MCIRDRADEGLYGRYILEAYSEEELQMAGDMILTIRQDWEPKSRRPTKTSPR